MHTRMIAHMGVIAIVLLPGSVIRAEELTYTGVEQKSASIDEAIPDALDQVIERAVNDTLPAPETNADRQARDQALSEAKERKYNLVDYTVTDGPRKRPGSPGYVVLDAKVQSDALMEIYSSQRKAVQVAPKYTILLAIKEEIVPEGGQVQQYEDGNVAAGIMALLVENGYDVKDAVQLARNRNVEIDFEKLEGGDLRTIQEIASDQGADIIVYGIFRAYGPRNNPRVDAKTGRTNWFWEVHGTARAVWRDNASLLFSIPFPSGERQGASAASKTAAAMQAPVNTGQTLGDQFLAEMRKVPPRTSIEFEIRGCKGFSQVNMIISWLKQVEQFTGVQNQNQRRGTAQLTMASKPDPNVVDCLAQLEEIEKAANADFHINIDEFGPNKVIGTVEPN